MGAARSYRDVQFFRSGTNCLEDTSGSHPTYTFPIPLVSPAILSMSLCSFSTLKTPKESPKRPCSLNLDSPFRKIYITLFARSALSGASLPWVWFPFFFLLFSDINLKWLFAKTLMRDTKLKLVRAKFLFFFFVPIWSPLCFSPRYVFITSLIDVDLVVN